MSGQLILTCDTNPDEQRRVLVLPAPEVVRVPAMETPSCGCSAVGLAFAGAQVAMLSSFRLQGSAGLQAVGSLAAGCAAILAAPCGAGHDLLPLRICAAIVMVTQLAVATAASMAALGCGVHWVQRRAAQLHAATGLSTLLPVIPH